MNVGANLVFARRNNICEICVRTLVIQSALFRYFWLDPKVTQRSRLRALHTPSRRLQVGKSGNSLRSDSLIFFRPARCSVGSPPEAEGTNAGGVRGGIPHCVRNDKGGIRNDKHSYSR
ncbi:MAG: hypothetical protein ACTTKI_09685 [Tannerella sp.]|uniref:hypothetical protein n=1 Tax=Tannerella sp. TaxID=2382127 RepID=UPI003FA2102C